MTISFRRPDAAEAETFAALHVSCWKEAYRGMVPDAILDHASVATRLPMWRSVLGDTARIVIGAYDDGDAAGFIMAGAPVEQLFEGMDGHIPALYVRATSHRLGIGRRLMGRAAKDWRARGGHALALGVLSENVPARAFYERLGGRLVRTGYYNWDGHALPDAVYSFENLDELARFA